jgi:small subunit ribosomal protein S16
VVKIRLTRTGRLHKNSFRIVACDAKASRDGKILERLGNYNPQAKSEDQQLHVDVERVKHWLSVGAQPTATVVRLLKKSGIQPFDRPTAPGKVESPGRASSADRPGKD